MPHYQVVIKDSELAADQEIARYDFAGAKGHAGFDRWVRRNRSELLKRFPEHRALPRDDQHTALRRSARAAMFVRPVGTVHDSGTDSECPEGRPNCRNCGDPAHAETCRAAGHCPDCGTKHGIAPDSVVTANGYVLKAV